MASNVVDRMKEVVEILEKQDGITTIVVKEEQTKILGMVVCGGEV